MQSITAVTTGVQTVIKGFNKENIREFYDSLMTLFAGNRPKVSIMFKNNVDGFDGFMTARHTFDTHIQSVAHVRTGKGERLHSIFFFNQKLIDILADEDGEECEITVYHNEDVPSNGVLIHDAIIEMVSADD